MTNRTGPDDMTNRLDPSQRREPSGLSCWQINLHHSQVASINLEAETKHLKNFIALVQEPWINRGTICGRLGGRTLHAPGKNSRVCIYTSNNINATQLNRFSCRDLIAVKLKVNTKEIIIASAYLPHDEPAPLERLEALVEHARQERTPVII